MNYHTILGALPAATFATACSASLQGIARRLIQHAAHNAPASLSERLEEEWLADFSARQGVGARLRLAIGCCWATRVITNDCGAAKVPAASSVTGTKAMTPYTYLHDASFFSRRTSAAIFIFCLHAVLIYLLAAGLVQKSAAPPPPTAAEFVDEPHAPAEPPPPLLPPTLEHQTVIVPDNVLTIDETADSNAIRPFFPESVSPALAPPGVQTLSRVLGGPGRGFPHSEEFYPPASRRLGETGAASVRVCVDGAGRLTAEPTIAQSSGSARLDEGAKSLAKAGSGHFRATTENGQPVNSCFAFRVKFAINN